MISRQRPVILNVSEVEARTGAEALRMAAEENPDLVALDAQLPDINGLEVCRRLKSDMRTQFVPVLHVSPTHSTSDDRAIGLDTCADGYLTQPVNPVLLVATVRSLLRIRRAEEEARQAAELWSATLNAISHGVCLLDAGGRVKQANRAMEALTGMPAQAIVGSLYNQVFPQVEPPPEGWPLERARKSGRRETAQLQVGERYLEIAVDPIAAPNGEFAGAVQTIIDITGQKRSEDERERLVSQLAGERARMEAVLRQMPSGVIIVEAPDGRLVMCNEQAARILGAPARIEEAVETLSDFKLLRPDSQQYPRSDLPWIRALTSGEVVVSEEVELVRGDGSRATLLVNSGPIRGRNGFIVAAVVTFQDVTERKELEKELRQSQKMDAVGRLAGGVAHDFNNLLTIISGYGQMIMDSLPPDDPVRKDLEAILEASSRATALTRQLLTFSRRQVVEPHIMDLNRQVSRMNRMLRRVIGEDIELKTSLKAASSRIKADPGQIEQVILNLALNSRDAMPHGGRLTIRTEDVALDREQVAGCRALAPGSYVMLSMTDTGTGMTQEALNHAFEPFFTTKAKGKGTGLGLSMVYGIVKQAGGDVTIESEPDKGTTVRLYFPVAGRPARVKKEREETGEMRGGTETILVVEDEPDVRHLASEMLKQQGYTVIEAGSGPEAVRLWRDNRDRIDLVLSDVVMPHMSGPEMTAELVKSKPGLKVIYMSGYTGETIARHGVLAQGVRFLQKPFTLRTLARKVRAVLDENTSTEEHLPE
jgi:two-component system cell cycle sensor histidine kinase/response regulator CckA